MNLLYYVIVTLSYYLIYQVNIATTLSTPTQGYPSASPPRRNQLNRSIPGSLLRQHQGWLRGTLPESPVDYRTLKLLKFCLVSSHVTSFHLVSSHVISQNLLASRFQKNYLVSSHVTLPLEPGAVPGPCNTLRQAYGPKVFAKGIGAS